MRVRQQYEELLRGDFRSAVKNLSTENVFELVRVTSSVQFLVKECAGYRLPELQKIHPES
jgi:hypothetical protein